MCENRPLRKNIRNVLKEVIAGGIKYHSASELEVD
jgi:hypothetical protein